MIIKLTLFLMLLYGFFRVSNVIEPYLSTIAVHLLATFALWQLSHLIVRRICKYIKLVSPLNKAVFITGCDTGFGHFLALRLNQLRFYVIASVLDTESDGAKSLKANVSNKLLFRIVKLDVTNDDDFVAAKKFVEKTLDEHKMELYAVVNNAGIALTYLTEWYPSANVEDYKRTLDVNFLSIVRTCRTFLPLLRQSHGRVVNLISYLSRVGLEGLSHYCASKHAAAGFTDSLVTEMDQFGVRVVSVEPWFYLTSMVDARRVTREMKRQFEDLPIEVRQAYGDDCLKLHARFTGIITSWPCASNKLDSVIDSLVEAIRSVEPPVKIVVAPLVIRQLLWFFFEFLPRDVLYMMIAIGKRINKKFPNKVRYQS